MPVAEEKKAKKSPKNEKQSLLDEMSSKMPLFSEDDYSTKTVEAVPSGSMSLDLALGNGGYPRGTIIDLFGAESAGKSLLSIMAIAQVQKMDGTVVVWDAERSYSKNLDWMRTNGVDTKKLKFLKLNPKQGAEIGFDVMYKLIAAGAVDLFIVDSVPSLVPQMALDRTMMQESVLGRRASMLTNALSRMVGLIDDSKTIVMFINQMRANVDANNKYAPKEKETSNWALKHYSTIRMYVKKVSKPTEENGVPVSHRVRVKLMKNKVAEPYRTAEFDIFYNRGVDQAGEVADILVGAEVISQKGAWFFYKDQKFQGLDKVTEFLRDPKELAEGKAKVLELGSAIKAFGVRDQAELAAETADEVSIESED